MNTPAANHDLFPEIAVPASAKPAKTARANKAGATQSAQALAPAGSAKGQADSQTAAPAVADRDLLAADLDAMARALEAHPDYRVLRRLQPLLQWPAQQPGEVLRVLVLDTETTGLDCNRERIMELAMLRVDVDRATGLPVGDVEVYDELEDPGKPIPPEVVALTGITDDQVRGKRLDEDRIRSMLDGVNLVIAHNAGFDRPFVEARMPDFSSLAWACSFADIDWKAQGQGSAKLESLAQFHGWFYDAHRAEMDCHALLAVLARQLPQAAHTGLAQLVAAASRVSYGLQATNAPFEAKDLLKARGYRWNADQRVWHTRLRDDEALNAECAWLKEHVYGARRAVVQVEKMDAQVRYSSRPGVITHQQL